MSKKIINLFIVFILLFAVTIPVFASEYDTEYQEKYNGNLVGVWDNADLFTNTEEANLFELAKEYSSKCDISVLFLTISDAKHKSTMVYSDDFFDHLVYDSGVSYNVSTHSRWGKDNPGVVFVIDMDNRNSYINTSGDVIDWFSDSEIDRCLSAGDSYLSNGSYYSAIKAISDKSIKNIYKYKSEGYTGDNGNSNVSNRRVLNVIKERIGFCIFIGLICALVYAISAWKKENKANVPVSSQVYVKSSDFKVLNKEEIYVRTYETVSHNYYKPSSSSSSHHSSGSSHHSSGGHSHGGGGHHF